ncbi:MAG: hypothetical protein GY869_02460 [Planctomycetes bacterium]|nr:hypothetical protein [Planctomycetota bacterium]
MAFDTSVLDAALARRQTDYERQRQKLLAKALRLLDELGPGYGIRQAYNVPIEQAQLQINLNKARRLYPGLECDITHFLQQLGG